MALTIRSAKNEDLVGTSCDLGEANSMSRTHIHPRASLFVDRGALAAPDASPKIETTQDHLPLQPTTSGPLSAIPESAVEALAKLGDGTVKPGSTTQYQNLHREIDRGQLLEGVGEPTPDWQRLNIVAAAIAGVMSKQPEKATALRLYHLAHEALAAHGFESTDMPSLVERLLSAGIVSRNHDGLYVLALSREEAAFKTGDVGYFETALHQAIEAVDKQAPQALVRLNALLGRCARASESWPTYPVESRWPFLKAVALLDRNDQATLCRALADDPQLRHFPLIDSALLMLEKQPPEGWVQSYAPHLAGSCVYTVAAEGWFAAGGLGRVQQYHAAAMKKLVGAHGRIATIEPYYRQSPGHRPIDYRSLPTPVQDLADTPIEDFSVSVAGRQVQAQVFKGTNEHGVEVYLIRDTENCFTQTCYGYDQPGCASLKDFSEFFSRASLELIRRLESKEHAANRGKYKPPAIVLNDGQAAPLVPFCRELNEKDKTLGAAALWMVTHTYRNRGRFEGAAGDELMQRWAIPEGLRGSFWRIAEADITSSGVRLADGASAVSAIHRDEVAFIDPAAALLAITNGDNREKSSRTFRRIMSELHPGADLEQPTPEQVLATKREAKKLLGLDPDRLVISYSGRLVEEKAGRERAFTDENIRALVKQGAQVVIYGNVQTADGRSKSIYEGLERLATELADAYPPPPRLVVKSGWGLEEQIDLLAATDVQVQDSDRGTGAAEYTEADVSANGGLQVGPPWIEGIIQRQGIALDRTQPGRGNTLIPNDASPAAYRSVLEWVLDLHTRDPSALAAYQASSVRISRVLEALLTGAEYLRQLDRVLSHSSLDATSGQGAGLHARA
jgi:hypothetical protein